MYMKKEMVRKYFQAWIDADIDSIKDIFFKEYIL